MYGVAQLVDHDVVAQMFGQRHQVEAERYVVAPRARTPLCAGGAYAHAPVLQAEASCERVEPRRQYGLGLGPESLDLLLCKLRRPYARSEAAACRLHPFCFCLEEDDGRSETYVGNDSRTSPEGRTESDMRRARAVRESVTSPSVGWCSVVFMLTCGS